MRGVPSPREHGTLVGVQQHRRKHERLCEQCWSFEGDRVANLGQAGAKKLPREHGTIKGYSQHAYDGTSPCRPCRDAYNTYQREYVRNLPDEQVGINADRQAASQAAMRRLRLAHLREYRRLVTEEYAKRGLTYHDQYDRWAQ